MSEQFTVVPESGGKVDPAAFHKMLADQTPAEQPQEPPTEPPPADEPQDAPPEEPPAEDAPSEESPDEAEAPPQEAAAEEPAADDPPEEEAKPVPPARLKKEIDKRRAAEAEAAAAKEQLAALNALLTRQFESKPAAEPHQQPEPEINLEGLDPLDPETTKALKQQIEAAKKELTAKTAPVTEMATLVAQMYYKQTLKEHQDEFAKDHPDFLEAMSHAKNVELVKARAFTRTEKEAQDMALRSLSQIAGGAIATGKNAGAAVYEYAKAIGYRKAEPKEAPKKAAPDPAKVAENRKKTESAASIPAAAPNPLGIYATKEGFEHLLVKPGGKVDPAKFNKMLAKERNSGKFVA